MNNCSNRAAAPNIQRGMTMLSMLVCILLGGLLITCVLKMVPVYIENWNIRSILNDLVPHFEGTGRVEKRDILKKIGNRMDIDMVDAISADSIEVKKENDMYRVSANYETRVALFGNVDVVMKFENNTVDIPMYSE